MAEGVKGYDGTPIVPSAEYLRDRVGVPRDMRFPAARQVRTECWWRTHRRVYLSGIYLAVCMYCLGTHTFAERLAKTSDHNGFQPASYIDQKMQCQHCAHMHGTDSYVHFLLFHDRDPAAGALELPH